MFTINGCTTKGTWVPVLGALLIGGEKHHGVEWGSAEQAARAAVIANPEMSPADLQVVNDETGETFSVADLNAKADAEFDAWQEDQESEEWNRDCAAMNAAERTARDYRAWMADDSHLYEHRF